MVGGPGHAGKLCNRIEQFKECGALELNSAKSNGISPTLLPSLFLSLEQALVPEKISEHPKR